MLAGIRSGLSPPLELPDPVLMDDDAAHLFAVSDRHVGEELLSSMRCQPPRWPQADEASSKPKKA